MRTEFSTSKILAIQICSVLICKSLPFGVLRVEAVQCHLGNMDLPARTDKTEFKLPVLLFCHVCTGFRSSTFEQYRSMQNEAFLDMDKK